MNFHSIYRILILVLLVSFSLSCNKDKVESDVTGEGELLIDGQVFKLDKALMQLFGYESSSGMSQNHLIHLTFLSSELKSELDANGDWSNYSGTGYAVRMEVLSELSLEPQTGKYTLDYSRTKPLTYSFVSAEAKGRYSETGEFIVIDRGGEIRITKLGDTYVISADLDGTSHIDGQPNGFKLSYEGSFNVSDKR